jgi:prepilin-type N-terminal cleavage/methylation domain-containing protein
MNEDGHIKRGDFMKRLMRCIDAALSGAGGFTLIELLTVIGILSILAVVAVSSYIGVQKSATRSEAYSNLQSLRLLEEQYFAENSCYQPLDASGNCPAGGTFDYTATDPAAVNTMENFLRGFRPGGCRNCAAPYGLNFTYRITQNFELPAGVVPVPYNPGASVPQTPCFVAIATGVAGTRVAGDVFAIDCNNNRNF